MDYIIWSARKTPSSQDSLLHFGTTKINRRLLDPSIFQLLQRVNCGLGKLKISLSSAFPIYLVSYFLNFICSGQVIREVDESLRSVSDLESVTRVILSLSRVSTQKCEACYGKISAIISTLIDHHTTCEDSMKPTLSRLLYFTMEALLVHSCDESTQDLLDIIPIQTYLDSIGGVIVRASNEQTPFSLWSLKCLDFLVHHMKTHKLHDNVLSYLRNNLIESLTTNLESGFKIVRYSLIS